MSKKRQKIPDEVLKNLEKKITNRVVAKIEEIVSKKMKEMLQQKPEEERADDEQILKHEIAALKNDWLFLQSEIGNLATKTDHILGSLSYIANKNDDLVENHKKLLKINQKLTVDIDNLNKSIWKINKQQYETEEQLDDLEQYGRRENLEIHGIPWTKQENTNEIVQKVARELNVKVSESDISTSHRLPLGMLNDKNYHPPIIVRFSNRDKRNEVFRKRHAIKPHANPSSNSSSPNVIPRDFAIRENLTKFRKQLFREATKLKQELKYEFLWTWQGQILIRKNASSKVFKISSFYDLNHIKNLSGKKVNNKPSF